VFLKLSLVFQVGVALLTVCCVPFLYLLYIEPNPSWFGNPANEGKKNNPNWTNENWLKSRFHFSFAEYSNPENTNFGVMRVMNDDLVQPSRGTLSSSARDVFSLSLWN
jgi:hypothetical protein